MVRREDSARTRHARPLLDAFLIMLFVTTVAGVSSRTALLQQFDWGIYDSLLDLLPLPDSRDVPLVIGIDERCLTGIGPWPWHRRVYAQAIQTLSRVGVQRIGIDKLMTEGLTADGPKSDANRDVAANDAQLAAAIGAAHNVYMPLAIDEQQSGGQWIEVLSAPAFIAAGAPLALSAAPALLSLLLAWQNLWFAPTAAMAGSLLTYPLWSWRRLDQTLRSVGEEVVHLHKTPQQTRLGSNSTDPPIALRFIHAVLPETRGNAKPSAHADPHTAQWLTGFSAREATRSPAADDSFEVLTRRLDALHSSIALQTDAPAAARRSLDSMRDGVVLLGNFGQSLFANTAARQLPGIGQDEATEVPVTLSRVVAGALIRLVDISAPRQAERAHREPLSFLSHDLCSPIVSLLALSGSLRGRHPDPDAQDSPGRIQRYAQRSLENAEQFLQMTRIENEPVLTRYELDLLAAAELQHHN